MVQRKTLSNTRFRRDAWLEINLNNLEYNIQSLYQEFKKPLIPVLKADAYGHGADVLVRVLNTFDFVHAYAVASVDEALILRESSSKPIFVLSVCPDWLIKPALEADIGLTLASIESLKHINEEARSLGVQAKVHLKLDSGMNRIGFKNQFPFEELHKFSNIQIETLYTHFVNPNDIAFTQEQATKFWTATQGLPYQTHIASTRAARTLYHSNPDLVSNSDFLRVGIELYGLENPELKPLMSLFARINHIKSITKGESVSYNRTWISDKDTRIATLALGYADGVLRALSNRTYAYCKGHPIPQRGLVTMDQIMYEIEDFDIELGDLVELIGPHCPLENWAKAANTISYEIACLLSLRLPKIHTR